MFQSTVSLSRPRSLVDRARRGSAGSRARAASRTIPSRPRSRARRLRRCIPATKRLLAAVRGRSDAGIHRQPAEIAAPGDAHLPEVPLERPEERLARLVDRRRRARIRAGHRAEEQRAVGNGARHRTEHRERVPGVRRGPRRHAPGRGTEADDIAVVAGIAQACREVGSVGERQHAASDGHGRATRGAAAGLVEVVGIARCAEHLVEGLAAGAELRRIGLADRDRAFGSEPRRRARDPPAARCARRAASRTWFVRPWSR